MISVTSHAFGKAGGANTVTPELPTVHFYHRDREKRAAALTVYVSSLQAIENVAA